MSQGIPCACKGTKEEKMKNWVVIDYKCNYSAFNGYKWTPSDYSRVHCPVCYRSWRTKAAYVDGLPKGHYKQ